MRPIRFEIWSDPSHVRGSTVALDFGAIVRSERLRQLLRGIVASGGVVIAALAERELHGYATVVPEHLPDMFELGSIEVARSHRTHGIGTGLLERLDIAVPIDRLVLYARGFVGHWDTEAATLSVLEYRRMLLRMLGRMGFQRWDTTDPEVNDSPMNFLAVRAGLQVPSASLLALAERASAGSRSPWW
jgi:GNAT superfamily N-acetyltransferase